jgi:hypothetical protein
MNATESTEKNCRAQHFAGLVDREILIQQKRKL